MIAAIKKRYIKEITKDWKTKWLIKVNHIKHKPIHEHRGRMSREIKIIILKR